MRSSSVLERWRSLVKLNGTDANLRGPMVSRALTIFTRSVDLDFSTAFSSAYRPSAGDSSPPVGSLLRYLLIQPPMSNCGRYTSPPTCHTVTVPAFADSLARSAQLWSPVPPGEPKMCGCHPFDASFAV